VENRHPLAGDRSLEIGESRDVGAGPGQACDKALADRIGQIGEHDRNAAGRLLHRRQPGGAADEDDIRLAAHQLDCGRNNARGIGPDGLDPDIPSVDPAQLLKRLHERIETILSHRIDA
jgi:hypothetical protein